MYFTPLKRVFLNLSGGTVTGNTLFTQSVSADTIYSGATNLYDIFAGIGQGGGGNTYLNPTQIAFGNSSSGLTGSTNLIYSSAFNAVVINPDTNPTYYASTFVQQNNGSYTSVFNSRTTDSSFGNPLGNGALEISTNSTTGIVFGTTTNSPISIGTNNIERVRIEASGIVRTNFLSATSISASTIQLGTPASNITYYPNNILYGGSSSQSFLQLDSGIAQIGNYSTRTQYYQDQILETVSAINTRLQSSILNTFNTAVLITGGTSGVIFETQQGASNFNIGLDTQYSAFTAIHLTSARTNSNYFVRGNAIDTIQINSGSRMDFAIGGVLQNIIYNDHNRIARPFYIGDVTLSITPTAIVDIHSASTSQASLRIRSGATVSLPNEGDIWNDGTHIYGKFGGTVKQLDNDNGSGTTYLPTNQIAFGSSNSGVSGNSLFNIYPNVVGGGYAQLGYVNVGYFGNYGIDISGFGNSEISNSNNKIRFDRVTGTGFQAFDISGLEVVRNTYSGVSFKHTNEATAFVDIQSASTSIASLRIRSGQTVSAPNEGDIWNNGSHFYGRIQNQNRELDNYIPTNQIAFGSETSGITSTSRFIHAPTTTASKFEFRDWVGVSDYPTIYLLESGVTASASNYTLTSDGTNSYLNSISGYINLNNAGSIVAQIFSSGSFFNSPLAVLNSFRANSVTATTVSATTLFSGTTNLSTTIISIANAAASAVDSAVQAGSNIATGGTASAPTISVVASPSLNALTLSGAGQFAGVTSTGLSATTVSGGTIYSGATNLSATIISIANAAASAVDSAVQAGSNIATGGTAAAPTISVVASPSLNALTLSGAGQFAGITSTGLSATTVSGGTIYSGATNLSTTIISIANAAASAVDSAVQAGSNITTGGTASAPIISVVASPSLNALTLSGAGQFAGVTSTGLSATTVSGGTIYSGATNLYSIFARPELVVNSVNAGSNIATGGTAVAPTISVVASPSLNALTLSGAGQFAGVTSTGLSATTVSGGTIYSGATNLSTTIISIANAAASAVDSAVQAGSNITTGGTASAPIISVVASPSLNALTLSGAGQFAGVTSTGLSATTLSAGTLYSGTTNLSTTIISISNAAAAATGDFTRVQGSNFITTGGTANAPIINLAQNFSGATVSGGTIYSGATNLYNIFATIGAGGSSTAVQPGSNITTGGTQTAPIVSVVASPSLNALTLSGAGQFAGVTSTGLSALTISGGTLYSGSTNLYNIFATSASGEANSGENIGGTSTDVATTAGIFKQKTGVLLEMRMLSAGTNISFITGDTITIQASGSGSATAVQPGLNTYTGGTSSAPTINISAATLVSLSANTITGTTIWGNGSNLTGVAHAFTGQTSISFSGFNGGETSYAITGVTNSNINSASTVMIRVIPSVNHPNVEESMVENLTFTQTDIVDGASFVINANADGGTWGVYNLVYRIIN